MVSALTQKQKSKVYCTNCETFYIAGLAEELAMTANSGSVRGAQGYIAVALSRSELTNLPLTCGQGCV